MPALMRFFFLVATSLLGTTAASAQSFEDFLKQFPEYEVGDKVHQGELIENMQALLPKDLLTKQLLYKKAAYFKNKQDSIYALEQLEKSPYWHPVLRVHFDKNRVVVIVAEGNTPKADSIYNGLPPKLTLYSYRNGKLVDIGYTSIYLGHRVSGDDKIKRLMQLSIEVAEDELWFDEYFLEIPDDESYQVNQIDELLRKDPFDIAYSSWNALVKKINKRGKIRTED